MAVYRRPFRVGDSQALVTMRSKFDGLHSELAVDGMAVATDRTPISGPEAIRNHRLVGTLPDGRTLEVEAGYVGWGMTVGVAARLDGVLIHESHPGKRIAFPTKMKGVTADPAVDMGKFKRNRVPLAVDIGTGLLFFVIAKMTDLTTAALVGAAVGIGLVVLQRFIKTDIIGGLALFGIVMLLISAGIAYAFQDDMAVKMRTTIVGLISAAFFLGDGLLLRGKRLGAGMARYLPYDDIDPRRLAIGVGVLGLVMAALNTAVARLASTDVWLVYHSFLDTLVVMVLVLAVFKYARGGDRETARLG